MRKGHGRKEGIRSRVKEEWKEIKRLKKRKEMVRDEDTK
jgi:hypothetical protein